MSIANLFERGSTASHSPSLHRGAELELRDVTVAAPDGTLIVDGIDFSAHPGELIAVIGASGAGKSTLLDVLAGNFAPTSGSALVDGTEADLLGSAARRRLGFVPQDEVFADDLSLGRLLEDAARLRLPKGSTRHDARTAAHRAMAQVDLDAYADRPVGRLSGGQRRRASIAVELVIDPAACLLDEPTSGLDPATSEVIIDELRTLADAGRTVVFVTHHANDLRRSDRVVALGPDGCIAFDGTLSEAYEATGAGDVDDLHLRLTTGQVTWAGGRGEDRRANGVIEVEPWGVDPQPSRWVQWWTLTKRTLETAGRNRLTLAIMVGAPAMVIAMFAVLFRAGAFDAEAPSPMSTIMIAFWVAFGGFFFGLTYGLLQICPEVPMMQRERRGGVPPALQILAKLTALIPILAVIDVAMLVVLRWLGRLPAVGMATYTQLAVTLLLDATAALALGLLASALVRTPAQASLALPMLCFPAVLFSGAVLPVPVMAPAGRAISAAMPDRWAFESIGNDLGLRELFQHDPSPLGPALLSEYGSTWEITHTATWLTLVSFATIFAAAACVVLSRRCRAGSR